MASVNVSASNSRPKFENSENSTGNLNRSEDRLPGLDVVMERLSKIHRKEEDLIRKKYFKIKYNDGN